MINRLRLIVARAAFSRITADRRPYEAAEVFLIQCNQTDSANNCQIITRRKIADESNAAKFLSFSFWPIVIALPAWPSTRRAHSRPDPRTVAMMPSASSVTDSRMCSRQALAGAARYECGTQIVGKPMHRKTHRWAASRRNSAGTAGAFPVVCRIDSAAQLIQGLSKSVREASKLCVALTRPWQNRCRANAP
jgi:hypothetical protein